MSWVVCRICLAGNDKMYSIKNSQLQDICEIIMNTPWNRDCRPDSICYICVSQLRRCSKFREMSQRSEEIFTQFFAGGFEFTEETIPILNKRKLHKFLVTPIQAYTIGFVSNYKSDEDDVTIKIENDPDFLLDLSAQDEKDTNLHSPKKEAISSTSKTSPHKLLTEKDAIQHNTTKKTTKHLQLKYINGNMHTPVGEDHRDLESINYSPKDTVKYRLTTAEINNLPRELETSKENSQQNSQNQTESMDGLEANLSFNNYDKCIRRNANRDTNSQSSESIRRSICFTLKFNIDNRNSNTKTLFSQTRNNPFPVLTALSVNKSNDEKPCYICEHCQATFAFKYSLESHMKTHKFPHLCQYCDRSFKQKQLLKLHKKTHEKQYACKECPKKFHRLSHLYQHQNTHDQKPYKCKICEKRFCQTSNLTQHMRNHTSEMPFNCNVCDKSFKQLSNLQQHCRVHTGERPYSCQICSRSFAQLSNLVQHRRIHNDEKPFGCHYCKKVFRQKSNLLQHLRSLHKEN